jgi:hypothetical protein
MSNDNRNDRDQFAVDVTDAVLAILRATVDSTNGPGQALLALTTATAALQAFVLRENAEHGAAMDALIVGVNRTVTESLSPDLGAGLVASVLRDVRDAREQHPTRFYGDA